jgi:hypothetical protein
LKLSEQRRVGLRRAVPGFMKKNMKPAGCS